MIALANPSPFDSSDEDMMRHAGCVNAGLPWHAYQFLFRELRLREALSKDKHFRDSGFTPLLA